MIVLGSAYWPNLHYMHYVLSGKDVVIDTHEFFEKQSYRNRTIILSANGPLALSIPVKKWHDQTPVSGIEISYKEPWQKQHWKALVSAYKNSPYFDFLEEEILAFYETEYRFLLDYNLAQLQWLKKVYRLKALPPLTESYIEPQSLKETDLDLRRTIHPKHEQMTPALKQTLSKPYYQTFSAKFDFIPNLSVLDLIFNEGIKTTAYLIGDVDGE